MKRRILPYIKIGRLVRFQVENCDRALAAFEINVVQPSPQFIRTNHTPLRDMAKDHIDQQPGR